ALAAAVRPSRHGCCAYAGSTLIPGASQRYGRGQAPALRHPSRVSAPEPSPPALSLPAGRCITPLRNRRARAVDSRGRLGTMPVIDADTHVDETDATWDFMEPSAEQLKPTTELPANPDPSRLPSRYWRIDGKRQLRFVRSDKATGTTV